MQRSRGRLGSIAAVVARGGRHLRHGRRALSVSPEIGAEQERDNGQRRRVKRLHTAAGREASASPLGAESVARARAADGSNSPGSAHARALGGRRCKRGGGSVTKNRLCERGPVLTSEGQSTWGTTSNWTQLRKTPFRAGKRRADQRARAAEIFDPPAPGTPPPCARAPLGAPDPPECLSCRCAHAAIHRRRGGC